VDALGKVENRTAKIRSLLWRKEKKLAASSDVRGEVCFEPSAA
jgi:hypothetical protein